MPNALTRMSGSVLEHGNPQRFRRRLHPHNVLCATTTAWIRVAASTKLMHATSGLARCLPCANLFNQTATAWIAKTGSAQQPGLSRRRHLLLHPNWQQQAMSPASYWECHSLVFCWDCLPGRVRSVWDVSRRAALRCSMSLKRKGLRLMRTKKNLGPA